MSELRRNGSLQSVGDLLKARISDWKMERNLKIRMALHAWEVVAGPQIGAAARPKRIVGETLYVAVRSSVWAQELQLAKRELLGRLNQRVGEKVFAEMRFSVEPSVFRNAEGDAEGAEEPILSWPEHPGSAIADIEALTRDVTDDDLKQALVRVITSSKRLQTWRLANNHRQCAVCGAFFRSSRGACPLCLCRTPRV